MNDMVYDQEYLRSPRYRAYLNRLNSRSGEVANQSMLQSIIDNELASAGEEAYRRHALVRQQNLEQERLMRQKQGIELGEKYLDESIDARKEAQSATGLQGAMSVLSGVGTTLGSLYGRKYIQGY